MKLDPFPSNLSTYSIESVVTLAPAYQKPLDFYLTVNRRTRTGWPHVCIIISHKWVRQCEPGLQPLQRGGPEVGT